MELQIKLISKYAEVPEYKTDGAAAMDLYAAESGIIEYGYTTIIDTGVAVAIPDGFEGSIRSRSGLRSKHGVQAFSGTIDSDYRGPIKVMMGIVDYGTESYRVSVGDRIAQIVISPVVQVTPTVVEYLDMTVRGTGGHGSTGY